MITNFVPELPQSDKSFYLVSRFDYNQLKETTRILVLTRAGEIDVLMKQNSENIVAIGLKLTEVKNCLGHGLFGKWLKAEFEWGTTAALRFMQVAASFSSNQIHQIGGFAPSALYLLAAPSTPNSARAAALERAAAGERITHKLAQQLVADAKGMTSRKSKPTQPLEDGTRNGIPHAETKLSSKCCWIMGGDGKRQFQVNLPSEEAGMQIERLARELDRLPETIVELAAEALQELPERKREILELEQKLLQSRSALSEQSQALAESDSRITDLEEKLAQAEQLIANLQSEQQKVITTPPVSTESSKIAELEIEIDACDTKTLELSLAVVAKNTEIAELEKQLAAFNSTFDVMSQSFAAQDITITELEQLLGLRILGMLS